ncbi:pyrimidodiazepine synthase-like isoform X1 [Euwallacea similis]|uniref:pyrimidodiazepine synthase-like isoform X1 n=1 Tax=Euwallacea similis TaxID=1736056 RepID=UPI003450D8AE
MSSSHLSKGSVEPPRQDGLLRLFSMQLCPFAHRVKLVLKAKQIPHDIVNINLMVKPEWYLQIHPEGKVPALVHGEKVVVESLDICDYLDENFPENPLYPVEPALKQKDKEVIQKISTAVEAFNKCLFGNEVHTPDEAVTVLLEALQPLNDELSNRGTAFFGGDKPKMVDYMFWPWAERVGSIALKFEQKLPFLDNHIPVLLKWRKDMRNDPAVTELYVGPKAFWKVAECKIRNEIPDYDSILCA